MADVMHKYLDNEPKSLNELKSAEIARRLKSGRGSGAGENYQPFLTVRDVPSKGRVHRLPGITASRVHHLLSDLELHIIYQLDWNPNVVDIREQFPASRDETRVIAEKLGIAHPSIHGVDQVVTTDFLVDIKKGDQVVRCAIYAKYSSDLENPRTIEKLQLEFSYWASKDINLYVVTEKELPKQLVQNISWIHPFMFEFNFSEQERYEYFELLNYEFEQYPEQKLTLLTSKMDRNYACESGTHLSILRHLVAQRAFQFDMTKLSIKTLSGQDLIATQNWQTKKYDYVINQ